MKAKSKKEKDSDEIVKATCPFCGKVVLFATDFSKIPDDISDDERVEIECGEEFVTGCEHVAFSSDWAYQGPDDIPDIWKQEMTLFANAIINKENIPQEVAPQKIEKVIDDYRVYNSEDDLKHLVSETLPNYDVAFISIFVCKNDGNNGQGGANYGIIFLQKKGHVKSARKKISKVPK